MRLRRPIYLGFALALVAGLLAAPTAPANPAAPAPARCSGSGGLLPDTIIPLFTLHMEWEPAKKRYRIGETARILVNVTRPGEEDPLGEGIPMPRPTEVPAEDVFVAIGVMINDVLTHGNGRTDEEGDATVRIPIPQWARPGPAHARGLAQKLVAEVAGCFWVYEYDFKAEKNFFRVTD